MEWNNALGSVLGLSDTKKADRRIAEIARSAFGADGASRRVTLSGFLTDLVVDPEVQKAGWDHSKAPDLVNAANYFALALNFSAIDDPFLKNEDSDLAVAGWLHERIGKIRKGEDRREFLVDLISRRISPWSDDIDEDNSGQIFYAVIELEWYRNHDEDFDFLAANKPISMWEMCLDCFEKASVRNLCGNEVQETFEVWRDSELTKARSILERERRCFEKLLSNEFELETHIDTLASQLDDATLDQLVGENQGNLVVLYKAIHDAFQKHGLISINRLASVSKDVHRVNQIETIIDLYNMKIHRTENDEALPEGVRERKVQALQHLMEKDIDALGGVI